MRVLARPAYTIDLTTLQEASPSLRADVDNILEMRGPELETASVELVEDTMLVVLFTTLTAVQSEPREHVKRHHSNHTTKGDEARARKKELADLEAARRASLLDEDTHQMRDQYLAVGASSSRHEVVEKSTTEGAETAVGTTEDAPTIEVAPQV